LFPDYGVVVARGRDKQGNLLEFAAKAGHNAEHHNHNDCGSFILNRNGEPALIEIGAPKYVGSYFSSDETRYTFLAARSLGHSVPLVNGVEQVAGAKFAATVLECALGDNEVKFVVNLTRCYPADARCRKLWRTIEFDKNRGVIQVIDAFEMESPGSVESIIICEAPVTSEEDGVRINAAGGPIRLTPGKGTTFGGVEVCSYEDHSGCERKVQRLRFRSTEVIDRGVLSLAVSVSPNGS
jgi:hypothetical protein